MNEKVYKFLAEIKKVPDINGAYIKFPFDVKQEFNLLLMTLMPLQKRLI